ncbi:unnamed protein product [Cochlearia groenlandica]
METKKSNKIKEIVKLQQILKKWRKLAHQSKQTTTNYNKISCSEHNNNESKGIKFLKRTLSFTDTTTSIPKGYLAVSVGKEEKRYKIPTEYLSHQAFHVLLLEAEEEFGFQQAGVLKIPCEVAMFETILKIMEDDNNMTSQEFVIFHPSHCPKTPSHQHHSLMCI